MSEDRIWVSAATHRGLVRKTNQDAILVDDWIGIGEVASRDAIFDLARGNIYLLIADGMGGHRGGAIASSSVVAFMQNSFSIASDKLDIYQLIGQTNDHLYRLMEKDSNLTGMGCTLVGVEIGLSLTTVFNVGDSRGYYFDGELRQITVDDTFSQGTETGAELISKSRGVTQAIGGSRKRRHLTPHINRFVPAARGRLLLCSDGLTDMLSSDEIESALRNHRTRSVDLVEKAIEAGGEDNVSVIIAQFGANYSDN